MPESVRIFGKAFHLNKCVGEVTVLEREMLDRHNFVLYTDQQRVEEKLCKAEVAVPEHYVSRDLYNLPKTKKIFQSISQKN